jgi:protein gp37
MSAGCAGCWAAAYHRRWRKSFVPTFHAEKLNEPMRLRKPAVIGVSFMGDLFHDELDDMNIRAVLLIAADCKRHAFVVLTKRAEKMRRLMVNLDTVAAAENVWIGVSVEDQATADERIPILLDTPAAHRWVSLEPQIGPVDFSLWLTEWPFGPAGPQTHAIDLVIQGCESGPRRRPFDVSWARSVRDQCKAAGTFYYYKQAPLCDPCADPCGLPASERPCFRGREPMEKPFLDGRQHLDLPWEVKP